MVEQRLDKPLVTSSNLVPGTNLYRPSVNGSTTDSKSAGEGSNPSGGARVLPVLHISLDRQGKASGLCSPRVLLAHSEMVITTDFDSVISCSSQDGPAKICVEAYFLINLNLTTIISIE